MSWKVISYYTPKYKEVSYCLFESLKKFDIPYDIEAIENKGSWMDNVYYKPHFIKRKLEEHKCDLVWLDIDCIIKKHPKYFDIIEEDLGIHLYRRGDRYKEIVSGLVFMRNNPQVKRLIDDWIYYANEDKRRDEIPQTYLRKAVSENVYSKHWVTLFFFPEAYLALRFNLDNATILYPQSLKRGKWVGPNKRYKEITYTKKIKIEDLHWDRNFGTAVLKTKEELEQYIDDLEKSIKKNGIKVPPNVRNLHNGKYKVLQGNHRCEVAKRLGWKEIECKVVL